MEAGVVVTEDEWLSIPNDLRNRAKEAISAALPDLEDQDPEAYRREVLMAAWIIATLE